MARTVPGREASAMTLRPALRPGAVLLRRDGRHLQIGTSPGYVLRDQPGLFSVIRLFDGIRDVNRIAHLVASGVPEFRGDVAQVVEQLVAAGLVFDARRWDLPGGGPLRNEIRAASLNGSAPDRVVERARFGLSIDADAPCRALAGIVSEILSRSGFIVGGNGAPDLTLLLSHGEPGRRRFEAAMEAGRNHLRVVVGEDRIRLGPMVRPGLTPCINCHDLHRADWDHAWPALMTQFGNAAGSPPALSATTTYAAATAIAAEVIACCEQQHGETTGHCLVVGPHHLDRSAWPVSFHPSCSCTLLIAA